MAEIRTTEDGMMLIKVHDLSELTVDQWIEIENWMHGDYIKEGRGLLIEGEEGDPFFISAMWYDRVFMMSMRLGRFGMTDVIVNDMRPIEVLLDSAVCIGNVNYTIGEVE